MTIHFNLSFLFKILKEEFFMADRFLTVDQLIEELKKYNHRELHVHHTWRPNHSNFNGKNHQELQDGMREFHIKTRKFSDIAQHVTLFPDGMFLTGRKFNVNPASILGHNHGLPFCVEMLGDFDKGQDTFGGKQKEAMLKLARFFYDQGKYIRFHRENASKTCPGTSIDKNVFMNEVKNLNTKTQKPVEYKVEKPKTEVKSEVVKFKVLQKGDRGEEVKALQRKLNEKGFNAGKVDGIFGEQTEAAVIRLQKATHIAVDGIFGQQSAKALETYKPPKNNNKDKLNKPKNQSNIKLVYKRILAFGSKGEDVRQLQEALNMLKFKCGSADGIYGRLTEDAVRRFQKVYLPYEVDGIAGKNTIAKINQLL
jgi:peptidoglycan hydrolase-like protein with peptidoglycan-binding domain